MTLSVLLSKVDPDQKIKVISKEKVVHETGHPLANTRKLVYFHGEKLIYKIDVTPEGQLRIFLID